MGALTHNGEIMQGLPANASQINFDKTGTDLNATQTENAIKEVNTKVNTNTMDINQLKSGLTNIKFCRGRATVQNGYFTLTNTGTSLTSGVVISLMRNDAEGDAYSGLSVYTAITTANEILVYIRKADGSSPENGTTVSYCYVAFN